MVFECKLCGAKNDALCVKKNMYICLGCSGYLQMSSRDRIEMVSDEGSFHELFSNIKGYNPLNTEGYMEKMLKTREKTGLSEAVVVGTAEILHEKIMLAVCDASFFMGSMGYVVGEKITKMFEAATQKKLPVVIFCCSGGARMQEGIISLMQMEKTAAAMKKHSEAGLFCCTVLTDPTMGGVTASFAMLGDVVLAEQGALIGFAGPRVIEQTTGQKLQKGFQTAQFQVQHGMVDRIVERRELRDVLHFLLISNRSSKYFTYKIKKKKVIDRNCTISRQETASGLTPWERVKLQRSTERISALEYIRCIFSDFMELRGDRLYGDDSALLCGIAMLDEQPVTIIAGNRGGTPEEMVKCNFGMPLPEGYRKALRLMKQAEKFNRPVICFVNTPGANCGIEAEERGQSRAIANNLYEISSLKIPVLSIITGEAGSGGALATAVADQVWMFENATYSIISPEGYASIMWKDASKAECAATKMHITAEELKELGVIEKIIPEYREFECSVEMTAQYLKNEIKRYFLEMSGRNKNKIIKKRYDRFRQF